ncbi:MAG: hypothetical protein BWY62_00231 [Firmicutes bacterium ADurb.Bin356]|nr:MAG: hypothetical protein BWY62_00231 [Firmicutes bacterium ADurb.Bin356]
MNTTRQEASKERISISEKSGPATAPKLNIDCTRLMALPESPAFPSESAAVAMHSVTENPAPKTATPATSSRAECAKPASTQPSIKTGRLKASTRFLPILSDSLPKNSGMPIVAKNCILASMPIVEVLSPKSFATSKSTS